MALLYPDDHGSLDDAGRGPHLTSAGGYTEGGGLHVVHARNLSTGSAPSRCDMAPVRGVTGAGDSRSPVQLPGTPVPPDWRVVPPIYRFQMGCLVTLQRC